MKIPRRRRLERKTDYVARFSFLKSKKPRIAARKTNKYIIAQIVETRIAQDKTIVGITSKYLLGKGWPKDKEGSLKSLPAAYLTGYALGKMAIHKKIKSAIYDMGMHRNVHGSRLFAFLKGAIDAGLEIPHSEESLPTEEHLNKNEKLKGLIEKVKEKL